MKVGDKVWLFSENRRVYPKDKTIGSSPIYSEHFYDAIIEGETKQSWIINRQKYPKKLRKGYISKGYYTDIEKAEKIWEHDNRRRICEDVHRCDIKTLKRIDELLKENKL